MFITDEPLLNLITQYLRRTAERGGLFWDHRQGISLGCPLSPVIGAFFLLELDDQLDRTGLFWRRYMDDVLVLAPTRWKLRRAVRVVQQVFNALGLRMHPEKAFIGRTEKGFEWLGYRVSPAGLTLATRTVQKFTARVYRLYEQQSKTRALSYRLGDYVRRWMIWVRAGLSRTHRSRQSMLLDVDEHVGSAYPASASLNG